MNTIVIGTKKLLSTVSTLIIVLGMLLIGLFIYGIRPYVVQSGSMEPTIPTGSVCFINQRYAYGDIQQNDIIAFKLNSGKMVTHRTINITENGMETKGDANDESDNFLTNEDNFVGKNIYSIPHVGYLVGRLQTDSGRIMSITIILVILVAGFFLENNNRFQIMKKQKAGNRRQ